VVAEPRTLIVYYSRSGTTRKIAQFLAASLHCEIEEIIPLARRSGAIGYWRSAMEATQKRPAAIAAPKIDPAAHDLVIIGTPVWAWSVSSPVRAYLMANSARLPAVAFICTFGNAGAESAFAQMEAIVGKAPRARCGIKAEAVASGAFQPRLAEFLASVRTAGAPQSTQSNVAGEAPLGRAAG
jgi:menaquinone-dependent protoporphyrinogen IX oxidase